MVQHDIKLTIERADRLLEEADDVVTRASDDIATLRDRVDRHHLLMKKVHRQFGDYSHLRAALAERSRN